MKECQCGLLLPDSADLCDCGASFRFGPPAPSKTKLCQYCKMSVPVDASTCGHCGQGISVGHTAGAVVSLVFAVVSTYYLWQWWSSYSEAAAKLVK